MLNLNVNTRQATEAAYDLALRLVDAFHPNAGTLNAVVPNDGGCFNDQPPELQEELHQQVLAIKTEAAVVGNKPSAPVVDKKGQVDHESLFRHTFALIASELVR